MVVAHSHGLSWASVRVAVVFAAFGALELSALRFLYGSVGYPLVQADGWHNIVDAAVVLGAGAVSWLLSRMPHSIACRGRRLVPLVQGYLGPVVYFINLLPALLDPVLGVGGVASAEQTCWMMILGGASWTLNRRSHRHVSGHGHGEPGVLADLAADLVGAAAIVAGALALPLVPWATQFFPRLDAVQVGAHIMLVAVIAMFVAATWELRHHTIKCDCAETRGP